MDTGARIISALRAYHDQLLRQQALLNASLKPDLEVFRTADGIPIFCQQNTRMVDGLGGEVWPGAYMLCDYIESDPSINMAGKRVVELGSGCGLCGLVCAQLGAGHVLITDEFVDLSEHNISVFKRKNHHRSETVSAQMLLWGGKLTTRLPQGFDRGIDYVIGSDITYDKTLHSELVESLVELSSYGEHSTSSGRQCECLVSIDLDTAGTRKFLDLARVHFDVVLSEPRTYEYCVSLAQRSGNHEIDYLADDDEHYCVARLRAKSQ